MTADSASDGYATGWRPDVAAVEVPKAIAEKNLHDLAFFFAPIASPPSKVDLSSYLEKLWGPRWFLSQGECGSCVAFGAALACDVLTAIDTVRNGRSKPSTRCDPMSIYWGSRVEIGRNRIRGQGSVGVWACEYLKTYGALPQQRFPEVDLSKYDPSVCCGPLSSRGVPDTLEPTARQYPVKEYAQNKMFDESVYALSTGSPILICSIQGFQLRRDANGFGIPSRTWGNQRDVTGHAQCVVGYELGDDPYLEIANSWGACYTGGYPGQNPAVMKVRKATADRMLKEGDSWALSRFVGFRGPGLDFSGLNF